MPGGVLKPRPVDYLQPDEEALLTKPRHPRSILAGVFSATIFWVLAVGGSRWVFTQLLHETFEQLWWNMAAVFTVLWLANLVALFYRMRTSRYVITGQRVYRSHGRLRFQLLQTTYDKVTDLHVRQGPLGRLWDYGEVTVMTAGTGLTFQGVPDPFGVKKHIEKARTAFLNQLLEEYRLHEVVPRQKEREEELEQAGEAATSEATSEAAVAGAGATVGEQVPSPQERTKDQKVWSGKPVFVSFLAAGLRGGALLITGVVFLFMAMATGEVFMWFVAAAGGFMGVSTLIGSWIQYRFTRYEVHPWGVVITSGWLTRRRVEVTYDKVTDVETYQGFVARIFNFGNITINTAGGNQAPVTFVALDNPEEIKDLINETRRKRAAARRGSVA